MIFVRTASVLEDFYRIDGFLKNSKKAWILGTFSEAEAQKNQEKIVLRNSRFSDIDFSPPSVLGLLDFSLASPLVSSPLFHVGHSLLYRT